MTERVNTAQLRRQATGDVQPEHMMLRAAANELDELRTAAAWQPMHTAPKDGHSIIIHDVGQGIVVVSWNHDRCGWEWGHDPNEPLFSDAVGWKPLPLLPVSAS